MTALVAIHVQPRAARSEVVGRHGSAIKIRLAAPPVDGAANEALIRFLADRLGVPRKAVSVVSGARSREKRVSVAGMDQASLEQRLLGASPSQGDGPSLR